MDQKSRSERLIQRLRDFRASIPDVEASAVVSADGLIVASDLPAGVEADRVSAMSAAMLSLGDRIANEFKRGELDHVYIHGVNGYVVLMSAGEEPGLTLLARKESKLGLIWYYIKKAAADIAAM